jgi:AraC-like DNA-binding protein
MISTIVIASIVFQTAVSLYLLNSRKLHDDFEKNINFLLIILFFHLGTKFFLLGVLKNLFLYNKIVTGFGLAYGPILYLTCLGLVGRPLRARPRFLHFVPFLSFTVIYIIHVLGYLLNLISNAYIVKFTNYYQWLVAISLVAYPLATKLALYRDRASFGYKKNVRTILINNIASVLLAGIAAGLFFSFTHFLKAPIANFDLRVVPYLCFSLIPVLILRYKLADGTELGEVNSSPPESTLTFNSPATFDPEVRHYRKSAVDDLMMNDYELTLRRFMDSSKLYLNAEITLENLSKQTNIPKHHVTQLLNERFKQNFYSFINEYRIREAVRVLENPSKEINILSLAYDCGFNSKSSFNKYFKKITDQTPSSYRKKAFNNSAFRQ